MLNNEKEGNTKWSIKLRRLKLVQHCIQLTIAKNENIYKTPVTFLVLDRMFVNSYYTNINLVKFCFCTIFHKVTFQTLLQLSRFSI